MQYISIKVHFLKKAISSNSKPVSEQEMEKMNIANN